MGYILKNDPVVVTNCSVPEYNGLKGTTIQIVSDERGEEFTHYCLAVPKTQENMAILLPMAQYLNLNQPDPDIYMWFVHTELEGPHSND